VIRRHVIAAGLSLWMAGAAWAVDTTPPIPDPALQDRYVTLTHELRCVQCQNETIADSPVEIAAQLRREVRESLIAGQSDDEIRETMVSRYSEFILFKPRWSAKTALLWLAPALMLLLGAFIALRVVGRRRQLLETDDSVVDEDGNV
jgi:cytochrome c-type biogenesis protein CcmH